MNRDDILAELFRLQDKKYADFQSKLIPTVEKDKIIGVRTPELRSFAKSDKDILRRSYLPFISILSSIP